MEKLLSSLLIKGSVTLENAGGNQTRYNIQPSLPLNYIICIYGTYPQRS